jgi:hypothetical protein
MRYCCHFTDRTSFSPLQSFPWPQIFEAAPADPASDFITQVSTHLKRSIIKLIQLKLQSMLCSVAIELSAHLLCVNVHDYPCLRTHRCTACRMHSVYWLLKTCMQRTLYHIYLTSLSTHNCTCNKHLTLNNTLTDGKSDQRAVVRRVL